MWHCMWFDCKCIRCIDVTLIVYVEVRQAVRKAFNCKHVIHARVKL